MAVPAVTVVTPLYNNATWIEACLQSLARQTLEAFEVVVDDGSADDGPERVAAFARRADAPPVRLIRHGENAGPGVARNTGVAAARAPLVAFLDADDVAVPERLAYQAGVMAEEPDRLVTGGWFDVVDAGDRVRARQQPDLNASELAWVGLFQAPFLLSTAMVRTTHPAFPWPLFPAVWHGEEEEAMRRLVHVAPGRMLPRVLALYRKAGESSHEIRARAHPRPDAVDLFADAVRPYTGPLDRATATRVRACFFGLPEPGDPDAEAVVAAFTALFRAFREAPPPAVDPGALDRYAAIHRDDWIAYRARAGL